ncbi:hypothetical protein KSF_078390 [Reticulibacter mediterranei]|uniref:Uncharacterized protein n=1 Tax=Reticulibacter mediterranei TaxID=2778369 RepID=A0A8J3IYY1_9CHLR|nr:hypothetical protein [Reticulibacter mediterranei]GHO97791.1 hypothetical protein KSF_078390 [Reticulibacter mediterranei]
MKKLVIRIVVTFALLFALGAVFGGVNAPSAHASMLTTTTAASPNINSAGCPLDTPPASTPIFIFHSLNGDWCFTNGGYAPVTIPDVVAACPGNNDADVYTTSGTFFVSGANAPGPDGCRGFPNGRVTVIGINIR